MSGSKNKKLSNTKRNVKKESSESDNDTFDDMEYNAFAAKSVQKKKQILKKIIESDSESESSEETDISSDSGTDETNTTKSNTNSSIKQNNNKKIPDTAKKSIKNSNEIFKELIKRQLTDVPSQWKLNINDMKRICKYIDTSIFDKNNCCIWNGYITNMNNSNKGTYVNFYFRNKKVALHRLLYSNFVAPLDSSEYLKFNCDNKGICCNINHYEKYKYSKNNTVTKKEQKHREAKKEIKEITIIGPDDPDKLIINFD